MSRYIPAYSTYLPGLYHPHTYTHPLANTYPHLVHPYQPQQPCLRDSSTSTEISTSTTTSSSCSSSASFVVSGDCVSGQSLCALGPCRRRRNTHPATPSSLPSLSLSGVAVDVLVIQVNHTHTLTLPHLPSLADLHICQRLPHCILLLVCLGVVMCMRPAVSDCDCVFSELFANNNEMFLCVCVVKDFGGQR